MTQRTLFLEAYALTNRFYNSRGKVKIVIEIAILAHLSLIEKNDMHYWFEYRGVATTTIDFSR